MPDLRPVSAEMKAAMTRPPRGWWQTLRNAVSEFNDDRALAVAAGVTFYGLLALFPAITAFVSIWGLFADRADVAAQLGNAAGIIPASGIGLIRERVDALISTPSGTLSLAGIIGLLVALWSANGGMGAMMDALNVAFDVRETRSFLRRTLLSLVMTLAAIGIGLVLLVLAALLPVLLQFVPTGRVVEVLLLALRWPIMFAAVMGLIAALYYYAPNRGRAQWRWITPGALIATSGFLGFSAAFSWYAANLAGYDATYGSLGAAIGLMTWMWLSAAIILFGAEINAEIDAQTGIAPRPGPARPVPG